MNQEKIGKFIAECRKGKKMTQQDLADKLGITYKAVSKWECGKGLPDVSLYKDLCQILGITLNEFFAGQRISDKNYKEIADKNLLNALENSTFTLKDKIKYFKKKWLKEHVFSIIYGILLWISSMLILKLNGGEEFMGYFAGMLAALIHSVLYNRMMIYVEKRAYRSMENNLQK